MSDIIIATLPFWAHMTPGLGPGLLKSYLKENGITCRLMDVNIHAHNIRGRKYASKWELSNGWDLSDEKIIEYYKDNQRLFDYYQEEIGRIAPKVVGFIVYYSSLSITKIFASELKRRNPNIKIIFGGPSAAGFMHNRMELLTKPYIDAVCLGEGERALVLYMNEVFSNQGNRLPGVIYKHGDLIVEPLAIEYIKNLDSLPFPDFDDYNLAAYTATTQFPSYTSRGCPNKCVYCTERNFFDGLRVRSAKRIMEEFHYINSKYPRVKQIRFFDSVSNVKISILEEFCDLKIKSGLKLTFNLENAVIRKEMRLPLYRKLKKAGCFVIGYGMETSSQDLLKDLGKILSIGVDLSRVLSEGKKAGLYISVNIMFGLPGETERHFHDLVEFIKSNKRSLSSINPAVNFCAFYPGSFVYDNPSAYGVDLSNGPDYWSTIDGSNTYPVRMRRFESFLKEVKILRINNLIGTGVLPNKYSLLFDYYFAIGDKENALLSYKEIPAKDITKSQLCRYNELLGLGIAELPITVDQYISSQDNASTVPDYSSLKWIIANFEGMHIHSSNAWNDQVNPIRKFVRDLAYRIIGMDRIEKHINSVLAIVKMIPFDHSATTERANHLQHSELPEQEIHKTTKRIHPAHKITKI